MDRNERPFHLSVVLVVEGLRRPNNSMQRTALRAAADAQRSADLMADS